jgi:hypothetical protein
MSQRSRQCMYTHLFVVTNRCLQCITALVLKGTDRYGALSARLLLRRHSIPNRFRTLQSCPTGSLLHTGAPEPTLQDCTLPLNIMPPFSFISFHSTTHALLPCQVASLGIKQMTIHIVPQLCGSSARLHIQPHHCIGSGAP